MVTQQGEDVGAEVLLMWSLGVRQSHLRSKAEERPHAGASSSQAAAAGGGMRKAVLWNLLLLV